MLNREFVQTGLGYVLLIALISLAVGSLLRAALPATSYAAVPMVAADAPRIVAVSGADGGVGWFIELDSGVQLAIESRLAQTGGVAPVLGAVQAFADQTCLLGACAGYAILRDGAGRAYHGFRP